MQSQTNILLAKQSQQQKQAQQWKNYLTTEVDRYNCAQLEEILIQAAPFIAMLEDAKEKNTFGELCIRVAKFLVNNQPNQARNLFLLASNHLQKQHDIAWAEALIAFSYMQEHLGFATTKKHEATFYCNKLIKQFKQQPGSESRLDSMKLLAFAHFVRGSVASYPDDAKDLRHALDYYENFVSTTDIIDDQYAIIKSSYAMCLARKEVFDRNYHAGSCLNSGLAIKEYENPRLIFESLDCQYWAKKSHREHNYFAAQFYAQFGDYYAMYAQFVDAHRKYKQAHKILENIQTHTEYALHILKKINHLEKRLHSNHSFFTISPEQKKLVPIKASYGSLNEPAETEKTEEEEKTETPPSQTICLIM